MSMVLDTDQNLDEFFSWTVAEAAFINEWLMNGVAVETGISKSDFGAGTMTT